VVADSEGEPLFQLKLEAAPRVRAEAGHVIVTLELVSVQDPSDIQELELILEGQYAATLGVKLLENVNKLGVTAESDFRR
jgi:hypothetical protein